MIGVTRKMASRKNRICSQPLRVMSELLRFQHRENQVGQQRDADEEADNRIHTHVSPHFISRSQAATYPMLTTKNRIETATNTRSSTNHLVLHNKIRDPRMAQE